MQKIILSLTLLSLPLFCFCETPDPINFDDDPPHRNEKQHRPKKQHPIEMPRDHADPKDRHEEKDNEERKDEDGEDGAEDDNNEVEDQNADEDFTESPEDVTELLEDGPKGKVGLLKRYLFPGFEKRVLKELDNLDDNYNLVMGFSSTSVYQRSTVSTGQYEAAGGDFKVFGTWKLFDHGEENWGMLGFSADTRFKYTSLTPAQFGPRIGILGRTVAGFDQQDFLLVQLWWEHHLWDDFFIVRFGKVDASDYIDSYRYQSPSVGFLTTPLEDMPTIPYPSKGPGLATVIRPIDNWYFTFAISERNSVKKEVRFDTFFDHPEYFTAYELGYQPELEGLGEGNYHCTFWYADRMRRLHIPSGYGFALSAQQIMTKSFIPFARYSWGHGRAAFFRQSAAIGFGIETPFGRDEDVYCLGLGWKQPFNEDLDSQYVIETFYRLQLTPSMQITPDLEIFFNRPLLNIRDVPLVFTIRFRWDL